MSKRQVRLLIPTSGCTERSSAVSHTKLPKIDMQATNELRSLAHTKEWFNVKPTTNTCEGLRYYALVRVVFEDQKDPKARYVVYVNPNNLILTWGTIRNEKYTPMSIMSVRTGVFIVCEQQLKTFHAYFTSLIVKNPLIQPTFDTYLNYVQTFFPLV